MKKVLMSAMLYTLPLIAVAQDGTLEASAQTIGKIVNAVIPIVGAILLIFFFVGALGYVQAGGDEEKRTEARNKMIYSVIGMFVAFSIFGLVSLLRTSFGVAGTDKMILPGRDGFFQF